MRTVPILGGMKWFSPSGLFLKEELIEQSRSMKALTKVKSVTIKWWDGTETTL